MIPKHRITSLPGGPIFIDTCSMLEYDAFLRFLLRILPRLRTNDIRLWIPQVTLLEFLSVMRNPSKKRSTKYAALQVLLLLKNLSSSGHVTFFGNTDGIADEVFLQYAMNHTGGRRFSVITDDQGLTGDLQSLSRFLTCAGPVVDVYQLTPDGEIVPSK